jgi:hypothetical protein
MRSPSRYQFSLSRFSGGYLLPWTSSGKALWSQSIVSPQEQTRLHVPQSSVDQHFALIKEWVPLIPAELIFNSDECSLSDWEERKPRPV